jgi:hypothetical protein
MGRTVKATPLEVMNFHLDFSTLDIQNGRKLIGLPHTASIVINPTEPVVPAPLANESGQKPTPPPGG